MRSYKSLAIALFVLCVVISCNQQPSNKAEYESAADTASSSQLLSSSAARVNKKDSVRKFLRTADLKFKVGNVVKSTYDIEDIITHHGGFVTLSNLSTVINDFHSTAINADSCLETTFLTSVNSMNIRIPNVNLDTTLKDISKKIEHLDYRIIKADDMSFSLLSNQLSQQRSDGSRKRLINAIDNNHKKLQETAASEEMVYNKQEQQHNALLANLSLKDQIEYSTININIYEQQAVKRELVANDRNPDKYTAATGYKIAQSFKSGWNLLIDLIIFIVEIWPLFLIGILVYLGVVKARKIGGNSNVLKPATGSNQ